MKPEAELIECSLGYGATNEHLTPMGITIIINFVTPVVVVV